MIFECGCLCCWSFVVWGRDWSGVVSYCLVCVCCWTVLRFGWFSLRAE